MNEQDTQRAVWLVILAVISAAIYTSIRILSEDFAYVSDVQRVDRPILLVLFLFTAAFVVYLIASLIASRMQSGLTVWAFIFIPAIVFRCLMLWSEPIQEIDIYRYLWDGAVAHSGASPFEYSPAEIYEAATRPGMPGISQNSVDPDFQKVVRLAQSQESLQEIISRIGYAEIRTVYPPISQLVFATVHSLTPENATVETRVNYMRFWLMVLELGTTLLVVMLLRCTELPDGWAVLHGWCPLLIKETANSGHLDAIAVFFMVLAIWLTMKMLFSQDDDNKFTALRDPGILWGSFASLAFAMAIGAKLFPVALMLWFGLACIWRLGALRSILPLLVLVCASWLILRPVLPDSIAGREAEEQVAAIAPDDADTNGFSMFLRHWEMNDFLFMLPSENLKDPESIPKKNQAWFVVLPESARKSLVSAVSVGFDVPEHRVPFLFTRMLLSGVFGILALVFAVRAFRSWDSLIWLRMAFLTIAWFWLLCPTQNPWYWTWAIPLLPFARCKTWWLMGGIVMAYYLRFWFKYHLSGIPVAGTSYEGEMFFHLVVTWIEYVPWLLLLVFEHLRLNWIADR